MTNIKPALSAIIVEAHSGNPLQEDFRNASKTLDTFLEEATKLHSHISSLLRYLRSVRQPYLSTAPPPRRNISSTKVSTQHQSLNLTDPQRDEIDQSTALLLHDLSSNIQSLTQAESLRRDTETALLQKRYGKPSGLLWKWAAGGNPVEDAPKSLQQTEDEGKATTLKTVRESVLWSLGRELQSAAETQREMVEKRVEREREKEKSILYKMSSEPRGSTGRTGRSRSVTMADEYSTSNSSITNMHPDYNPATAEDTQSIESQLSPAQLQLFASENNVMLRHYEDQLSKIQTAEKSLLEISSLQQTLVSHLSVQGEMIDTLVGDALGTGENLQKGNKELARAAERGSTARSVFWGSVVICGFLIGWDLVF